MTRNNHLYQPFYCEENIWHLCQRDEFEQSHVVFVSSKNRCFPMLNQRAAVNPSVPVFWDYHVVLLVESATNKIFDFDTVLPFNTNVRIYFRESFLPESVLMHEELPLFRVIPAKEFVKVFTSDRRHMRTEQGWNALPPSWPSIGNKGSNLFNFVDMNNEFIGDVLTYDKFIGLFE